MPPPLQVLTMGCGMCFWYTSFRSLTLCSAVAIIAAKALWLEPGKLVTVQEIRASAEQYIQSQIPELVKRAVLEAFQDVDGPYDTPQHRETLLSIILNNQI
ncbi:hypothetical protein BOTBODRAFT_334013 [Botryobasidium botryosum FD-172 SS1]|uniref:Uncharacterized protein n=1 Tax=Botryobasidium botryosum (strain FD-172 SS1) TaxID=930990 RepID=A0A067MGN2_BOTB1|nr:hypothetical protein BOTBODRAFT_334013 [Botryobasidium botryosum FD-172 SS1]